MSPTAPYGRLTKARRAALAVLAGVARATPVRVATVTWAGPPPSISRTAASWLREHELVERWSDEPWSDDRVKLTLKGAVFAEEIGIEVVARPAFCREWTCERKAERRYGGYCRTHARSRT